MLWFILSLSAALFTSLNDVISKRFFGHLSAYTMGIIRLLYALPYLLSALFIIEIPELDSTFWRCVAIGIPLEITALLSYMKAIKSSPLSLTVPFLAFTPVFMILTGFLILGEKLAYSGIFGIILIVAGSYVLNLSKATEQWLAPLRAIFKEKGSYLMLLTSSIYSITATLGKLAILHSTPQAFSVIYFLILTASMCLLFPLIPGTKAIDIGARPLPAILSGIILAGMIFCHTTAISLIEAAYMISVKRTSLIFGVIFGAILFKEHSIKERFIGVSIMFCGVVLIVFSTK